VERRVCHPSEWVYAPTLSGGVPSTRVGQAAATTVTGADAWLTYLYDSYRNLVFRFCLARLRSREEADDAVQNTFLRAYTALRRGIRPENEGAWLFKIAHNVCLSRQIAEMRRTRMENVRDFDDVVDFVPARERAEPDELERLGSALASLPAPLRQVILLRDWQGLSYGEIADVLQLSHSAVETRIFRARRALAQVLRPGPEAATTAVAAA
jgi:RNA polymerase sigma-70 factor, ECF subfamily